MKFISGILVVCALTTVSAFARQRGGNAAAAGRAAASPINYETAWRDKNVTAIRIQEKITLDGRLEEPAWEQAIPATDFTQWARPGVPATNKTEARVLYDDDNLYVAVNCWDKDIAHRVVNELKKDFGYRDTDGVSVFVDSLHDRQSAFRSEERRVGKECRL